MLGLALLSAVDRSPIGLLCSAEGKLDFREELTSFIQSVKAFQKDIGFGRRKYTDVPNMMRSLIKRLGMVHCIPIKVHTAMVAYPK